MIIDNYNFFRDKLEFTNPGDFYVIHIVIRRKDITENSSNLSKLLNNNVDSYISPQFRLYCNISPRMSKREELEHRVLFTYFISSIEQYDSYEKEIKELCKIFQARAYFLIIKQNNFKVWQDLKNQIDSPDHNIYKYKAFTDRFTLYQIDNKRNIIALLDLDGDEVQHKDYIIKNILKWRFMYEVQSPHGCHLIYNHHTPDIFDKIKELLPHKMSLTPQTILYYNDEKNS